MCYAVGCIFCDYMRLKPSFALSIFAYVYCTILVCSLDFRASTDCSVPYIVIKYIIIYVQDFDSQGF